MPLQDLLQTVSMCHIMSPYFFQNLWPGASASVGTHAHRGGTWFISRFRVRGKIFMSLCVGRLRGSQHLQRERRKEIDTWIDRSIDRSIERYRDREIER